MVSFNATEYSNAFRNAGGWLKLERTSRVGQKWLRLFIVEAVGKQDLPHRRQYFWRTTMATFVVRQVGAALRQGPSSRSAILQRKIHSTAVGELFCINFTGLPR